MLSWQILDAFSKDPYTKAIKKVSFRVGALTALRKTTPPTTEQALEPSAFIFGSWLFTLGRSLGAAALFGFGASAGNEAYEAVRGRPRDRYKG
jgi:hypothetical protein